MRETLSDSMTEWQIEAVKKYAIELKEEEIEHSSLSSTEKNHQKGLWEQWIDETTKGFKDVLKRDGRMISL